MRLSDLSRGETAQVVAVEAAHAADTIARRLRDLGFVRGEAVRIVAMGPFGAEPVLVQVGNTRFALRRAEAARVRVTQAVEAASVEPVALATPAEVAIP